LRGINVAPVVVSRAVGAVARELRIHPVRDWLDTLRWDDTPRIATLTSAYLGAEPTALHHTIGALWLISAVARIYRPGVKADHMLILEGPQGARKSTAIKVLAGEDCFTDELPELGSKDAALHMQGIWIVEIAELDAIGRADVSRIKAFLTRTTDRFRPPYGRYTVEVPRQCVFAGSVNPDTYLRDETGNRRFWPLRCGTIDIAALARDRDQLWAEAVYRFREGAIWWIDDPALLADAREAQDRRYQSDAWDARIDRWLTHETRTVNRGHAGWEDWQDEEIEESVPIRDVSVGEILEGALGIEPAKWTKSDQMRVGAWLKSRNWERYQCRIGETREWRHRRLSETPAEWPSRGGGAHRHRRLGAFRPPDPNRPPLPLPKDRPAGCRRPVGARRPFRERGGRGPDHHARARPNPQDARPRLNRPADIAAHIGCGHPHHAIPICVSDRSDGIDPRAQLSRLPRRAQQRHSSAPKHGVTLCTRGGTTLDRRSAYGPANGSLRGGTRVPHG
jgi:hypothetical protein